MMGAPPAAPRLALLALLLAASEPRPSFPGDPRFGGPLWRSSQGTPLPSSQAATKARTAAHRDTPAPEGNVSTGGPSQLVPPTRGRPPAGEEQSGPVLSRRTAREVAWRDSHPEPGSDAASAAPRVAPPSRAEDGAWRLFDRGKGGPGSQEEAGSGDPHAKTPPSPGWATAALPPRGVDPQNRPLARHEGDLLLDPTRSTSVAERPHVPQQGDAWGVLSSRPTVRLPETEDPGSVAPPVLKPTPTPKPSADPPASEIVDVDYYDLFDGGARRGAGVDSTKPKSPVDQGVSWPFRDLYDEFSPFDESDFYPTTSFYTDGDEEEEPEEEEEEEEDEEEEEEGGPAGVAEDEKTAARAPTPPPPPPHQIHRVEPTARRFLLPPPQTFVVSGGVGRATRGPASADAFVPENSTECRQGYARHNHTCKSVCDTFPSYCHNGGQCYLVESLGAFCRCNTQDYIWHKGLRCESIVTDFQVMCVAVGSAALVVLLLFMMTVVFAKKLYLLKTENLKLRKSKYRTPSELHNDNFSLSTIAEGSHPNVRKFCDTPCKHSPHARALAYYDNIICQDDPGAPHKLPDPLKSCLKDEEAFNIQNSTSPKLDNRKTVNPDDPDANCLQNNLT
ncbi:chondroitin sulfate proteoglycan 5 isoform X2 [Crotalus tigris]|uniref:chondroitin sulfate proteoglycan 5 isoform X2 n=1 Tax=Crotalus tigris TaxID=88082 RepID=UPI00192F9A11|nr:chondroitin sulfate proteoglycan 5 isoform X2 [Crotalus tigris]